MAIERADLDIYEEAGRGSFGIVYRGVLKATGVSVAIKQIDLEAVGADEMDEISREIHIVSECHLPHITKYLGCFVLEQTLWVILEFVDGGSLRDALDLRPVNDEHVVLALAHEITLALEYLHGRGTIHRDLKLHNVLLGTTGCVKLADFGVLARVSSYLSRRNTTVGTPYWMAPEIVIGRGGHSFAADIWLLGCCVYEIFTGKPPLMATHKPMAALRMLAQCRNLDDFIDMLPWPELNMSAELSDFLQQCFAVDPLARPLPGRLLQHAFLRASASGAERKQVIMQLVANAQENSIREKPREVWSDVKETALPQVEFDFGNWPEESVMDAPLEISKSTRYLSHAGGQSGFRSLSMDSTRDRGPTRDSISIEHETRVRNENERDMKMGRERAISEGRRTRRPSRQKSAPVNELGSNGSDLPGYARSNGLGLGINGSSYPMAESFSRSSKAEFQRVLLKVSHKVESRYVLGQSEREAITTLQSAFLQLMIPLRPGSNDSKILGFQYLKYVLKEIARGSDWDRKASKKDGIDLEATGSSTSSKDDKNTPDHKRKTSINSKGVTDDSDSVDSRSLLETPQTKSRDIVQGRREFSINEEDPRELLQRLIVPSIYTSHAITSRTHRRNTSISTEFDEIEHNLLDSWIDRMQT